MHHGLRILAVFGSKIILPNTKEIQNEFGVLNTTNPLKTYTCGLASVVYDVLNHVVLDAVLTGSKAYEVEVAREQLNCVKQNDLIIFDRGYCSYRMMPSVTNTKADFLIRCSKKAFSTARKMFYDDTITDKTVSIKPSKKYHSNYNDKTDPKKYKS